jgi:hypothetical protein
LNPDEIRPSANDHPGDSGVGWNDAFSWRRTGKRGAGAGIAAGTRGVLAGKKKRN